jgi:hypothetical protein
MAAIFSRNDGVAAAGGAESVHHSPKCVRCSVTVGCTKPPAHGPSLPVAASSGHWPCTCVRDFDAQEYHLGPRNIFDRQSLQ